MVFILYDLDIILSCLKSYWATERRLLYKKKHLNYSMCSNVKKIEENDLKDYTAENMYDWIIIRKRVSIFSDLKFILLTAHFRLAMIQKVLEKQQLTPCSI